MAKEFIQLSVYMRGGTKHIIIREVNCNSDSPMRFKAEDVFRDFMSWYGHGNVEIIKFEEHDRILVLSRSDVGSYCIHPHKQTTSNNFK